MPCSMAPSCCSQRRPSRRFTSSTSGPTRRSCEVAQRPCAENCTAWISRRAAVSTSTVRCRSSSRARQSSWQMAQRPTPTCWTRSEHADAGGSPTATGRSALPPAPAPDPAARGWSGRAGAGRNEQPPRRGSTRPSSVTRQRLAIAGVGAATGGSGVQYSCSDSSASTCVRKLASTQGWLERRAVQPLSCRGGRRGDVRVRARAGGGSGLARHGRRSTAAATRLHRLPAPERHPC